MTPRTTSINDVRATIQQLTESGGRPPSVLGVANKVGLSNTTFRRNYPEIVAELQEQRRQAGTSSKGTDSGDRYDQVRRENAVLRSRNRELASQLERAAASIQRLAIDNEQLRQQLEQSQGVSRLSAGSACAEKRRR